MHVSGFPFDLYPLLQFVFTTVAIAIGVLHLVKSTASKYFTVDANFEEGREGGEGVVQNRHNNRNQMIAVASSGDGCAVCGNKGEKKCSRCKSVRYCSKTCQSEHWKAGHNLKCQELKAKASVCDSKSRKELPLLKKVIFPYEEFVKLFNSENIGFHPCGLLNCGNSCYANVVLQCLSCTRPLIAYLLEVGHAKKCRRNDWCFLCEFEIHIERTRRSRQPFSPISILSRLPNIGGNLGYGKQEDAHEFMRFAIDTMQSVCLDEFGGEKALHPSSQETTLIQYIFGGHLQSQVKCLKCHKISYRHENMMDLTVEIQGDAESLEECLDQFTAEEWLEGENMYKCDGCNDYVKACKRLAIYRAPNILTIALKRFQSGRFGKLNKRVTFPETLDLGPYMSEPGFGTDFYQLYAVVVHIDMLNASYFGHYICYTKDFSGNWCRIDDCKVTLVELEEVLAQGAYMLLYRRMRVRPLCVRSAETCKEEKVQLADVVEEAHPCSQAAESVLVEGSMESISTTTSMPIDAATPTEKQQGVNVPEEAQHCLRLPSESFSIEGSISSLGTMPGDISSPTVGLGSQKDDSLCANLDGSVDINSVFARKDSSTSTADIPIDLQSSSLDMDVEPCSETDDSVIMKTEDPAKVTLTFAKKEPSCSAAGIPTDSQSGSLDMDSDGLVRSDLMPPRGDQLHLDLGNIESSSSGMELNDWASKHSDVRIASFEIFHEGVSTSVPVSKASPLVGGHKMDCEVSTTNFEDNSSVGGNGTVGNEKPTSNQLPGKDSLPNRGDTHEMGETSCGLPCSGSNSVNSISSACMTKGNTSKVVGGKSCSNGKQRPLFSPGFLNKHSQSKSPNSIGKIQEQPGEVGISYKVSSNCNGFTKPGVSQNSNVIHDQNGLFNSDDKYTPNFIKSWSEKYSNGVEPGDGCCSVSPHVDEIAPPVKLAPSAPVSAPLAEASLLTSPYDFGHEIKGHECDVADTFGNGNSYNKTTSEKVGSLSGLIDHEMNGIPSGVPVASLNSDAEMLDDSKFESPRSPIQTASCNGIHASSNMGASSSKFIKDKSSSRQSIPAVSSDFVDKNTSWKFQNRNDAPVGHGVVGSTWEVNDCNGSAKPGSILQTSRVIENQCENIQFMDEDVRVEKTVGEAGDPQRRHCNGSGSYTNFNDNKISNRNHGRLMSNGKNAFSPGFLNKPPRKKLLKKDEEGSSLSDIVSSGHDRNKFPRAG